MSEDQQLRLFQPFAQADASTARRFGGTGLGLSISRRLVRLMGGGLAVDSAEGKGSTFRVQIPLPPASGEDTPHVPDLSGVRVTLILANGNDAPAVRYLRHAKARVTLAGDLRTARRVLAQGDPPDVIVLDMTSGPGAGDLLHDIRRDPRLMVARLITITDPGRSAAQYGVESLNHPVRRADLWVAVSNAAGRAVPPNLFLPAQDAPQIFSPPSMDEARTAHALILVVEDNPTNMLVIRKVLERLGYAALSAADGFDALDMLKREQSIGLVLTDCHMPDMDGYELTRRIRAAETDGTPRLPIIALTADILPETEAACRNAGMDDFLTKPVESTRLDALIRRWLPLAVPLRRSQPAPENVWPVLDLTPLRSAFGAIDADAQALLHQLVPSLDRLIDEIDDALGRGDRHGAAEAAHSAKGASRSTGAVAFAEMAAQVEAALRADDNAKEDELLPRLRHALTALEQAVRTVRVD